MTFSQDGQLIFSSAAGDARQAYERFAEAADSSLVASCLEEGGSPSSGRDAEQQCTLGLRATHQRCHSGDHAEGIEEPSVQRRCASTAARTSSPLEVVHDSVEKNSQEEASNSVAHAQLDQFVGNSSQHDQRPRRRSFKQPEHRAGSAASWSGSGQVGSVSSGSCGSVQPSFSFASGSSNSTNVRPVSNSSVDWSDLFGKTPTLGGRASSADCTPQHGRLGKFVWSHSDH